MQKTEVRRISRKPLPILAPSSRPLFLLLTFAFCILTPAF